MVKLHSFWSLRVLLESIIMGNHKIWRCLSSLEYASRVNVSLWKWRLAIRRLWKRKECIEDGSESIRWMMHRTVQWAYCWPESKYQSSNFLSFLKIAQKSWTQKRSATCSVLVISTQSWLSESCVDRQRVWATHALFSWSLIVKDERSWMFTQSDALSASISFIDCQLARERLSCKIMMVDNGGKKIRVSYFRLAFQIW